MQKKIVQIEFLTLKEVAKLLRVSELTIKRWVKAKKLPAYKMGKLWRFNSAAINTWISGKYYTGDENADAS